jgi:hypothetical protein
VASRRQGIAAARSGGRPAMNCSGRPAMNYGGARAPRTETIWRWRGHGAMALGESRRRRCGVPVGGAGRSQAAAMWCAGEQRWEVPGGGAQGTLAASMWAPYRWLSGARTSS